MKKKICSKCKEEKNICEFGFCKDSKDGIMNICKLCKKEKNKLWRINNLEKTKKCDKVWRLKNLEYRKKYMKEYRKKNWKDILKKTNEYEKKRKKDDPIYKLKNLIRKRIHIFLKTKNITKSNKTFEIVGCSPDELKKYLENKFTEGMTWKNQGEWHIDHIIPLSSANTNEKIYELCYYTNLQPLWAEDNLKKGSK